MTSKAIAKLAPATWLPLVLLLSSGGCTQITVGDLRDYHSETMRQQATACAADPCPDMVSFARGCKSRHEVPCAIDPVCFGYHPTCWRPWPAECPSCPPFAAMPPTSLPPAATPDDGMGAGQRPSSPFVPEAAPPQEPAPLEWKSVPAPRAGGDKAKPSAPQEVKGPATDDIAPKLPPAAAPKPAPTASSEPPVDGSSQLPPVPPSKPTVIPPSPLPPAPPAKPPITPSADEELPSEAPLAPDSGRPGALPAPSIDGATRPSPQPANSHLLGNTSLLPERSNLVSAGAWLDMQGPSEASCRTGVVLRDSRQTMGWIESADEPEEEVVVTASHTRRASGPLPGGTALLPERSNLTSAAIESPLAGSLAPASYEAATTEATPSDEFYWIGAGF